jgi:hypothetical protein
VSLFTFAGLPQGGGGNIAVTTGGITIAGAGNLVSGAGLVNASFADPPLSGDPALGPLADHGGPTFTMLPAPGSAAIDALPPQGGQCPAAVDQRGIARPVGAGCDIGAVEQVFDRIFADGFDARPIPARAPDAQGSNVTFATSAIGVDRASRDTPPG